MNEQQEWASSEEMYFYWYLCELQDHGFINRWIYQPKPFPLSNQVHYCYIKHLKTKDKTIEKVLLNSHRYQADFLIIWNDKAKKVFFAVDHDEDQLAFSFVAEPWKKSYRSIVDVKGGFNRRDTWRRFSIDQKWIWQKFSVYVQKIEIAKLFKQSFTPERYLWTDQKKGRRGLKYTPKSIHQFLNGE